MSDPVDAKPHGGAAEVEVEAEAAVAHVDHAVDFDEKAKVADYKADAIAAEDAEHNMTVLEAVRAYPMAAFWAFIMSFCIVSSLAHWTCPTRNRS
jgi:SP family general alpha glucoside:H+ symporter-like MFS transporter